VSSSPATLYRNLSLSYITLSATAYHGTFNLFVSEDFHYSPKFSSYSSNPRLRWYPSMPYMTISWCSIQYMYGISLSIVVLLLMSDSRSLHFVASCCGGLTNGLDPHTSAAGYPENFPGEANYFLPQPSFSVWFKVERNATTTGLSHQNGTKGLKHAIKPLRCSCIPFSTYLHHYLVYLKHRSRNDRN